MPVDGVACHAPQIFHHALLAYLKTATTGPAEKKFLPADVAAILFLPFPFGSWSAVQWLCFHLNCYSECIPRSLLLGMRANLRIAKLLTVEASLQLAAGSFNDTYLCLTSCSQFNIYYIIPGEQLSMSVSERIRHLSSLSWLLIHGKQVCQVVLILRSVFRHSSGGKPSEPHQLEGIFESYLRLMDS